MECGIPAGCCDRERASKSADDARLGGVTAGSGDAFHGDFPVCGSKRPAIHIAETALTYVRQFRQRACGKQARKYGCDEGKNTWSAYALLTRSVGAPTMTRRARRGPARV